MPRERPGDKGGYMDVVLEAWDLPGSLGSLLP
jgi:hypothetical protein